MKIQTAASDVVIASMKGSAIRFLCIFSHLKRLFTRHLATSLEHLNVRCNEAVLKRRHQHAQGKKSLTKPDNVYQYRPRGQVETKSPICTTCDLVCAQSVFHDALGNKGKGLPTDRSAEALMSMKIATSCTNRPPATPLRNQGVTVCQPVKFAVLDDPNARF